MNAILFRNMCLKTVNLGEKRGTRNSSRRLIGTRHPLRFGANKYRCASRIMLTEEKKGDWTRFPAFFVNSGFLEDCPAGPRGVVSRGDCV